jgi:hypothetical protein
LNFERTIHPTMSISNRRLLFKGSLSTRIQFKRTLLALPLEFIWLYQLCWKWRIVLSIATSRSQQKQIGLLKSPYNLHTVRSEQIHIRDQPNCACPVTLAAIQS